MFSLDFKEFLDALNVNENILSMITDSLREKREIPQYAVKKHIAAIYGRIYLSQNKTPKAECSPVPALVCQLTIR